MNKKGQIATIITEKAVYVIMLFISALLVVTISIPMLSILGDPATGLNNTGIFHSTGPLTLLVLSMIPMFFIIVGLIGLFSPGRPAGPPQQYYG